MSVIAEIHCTKMNANSKTKHFWWHCFFLGDTSWKQLLLFPRSNCSEPLPLSSVSREYPVNTGHTFHMQWNGLSRIITFKQFQILEKISPLWPRTLRTNLHHSFPNTLVNTKHLTSAFENPPQKKEWKVLLSSNKLLV